MNIDDFIEKNWLNGGDVIIARKRGVRIFSHYIVFLGCVDGGPMFTANMWGEGVVELSPQRLSWLLREYKPESIRRYTGSEVGRLAAVNRGFAELRNNTGYNLAFNNCEHYANYVQYGKKYSAQSQAVGWSLVALGLIALSRRS